ncbi:hypothetical protein C8Q80DRAFT_1192911 [Daedaleopsis nitida]|nr:hypothetical protein C8Q80DRAFT_1192911 [Daedaleopsis nitida]
MNKAAASTTLRVALPALFLPALTAPRTLVRAATSESTVTSPLRTIDWGPCEPFGIQNSTFSCGVLAVPLDYHDPAAGTGHLAVVKANATSERRRSLLHNPGGPGVSGLQTLTNTSVVLDYLNDVTGGHYDIVSWDPRGVGVYSIPGEMYCFDSPDEYDVFFNGTIETTGIETVYGTFTDQADLHNLFAQAETTEARYRELGKRCGQREGARMSLEYVGTVPTARDLVALADALDGPGSAVHYYGHSYGTLLGAWFVNTASVIWLYSPPVNGLTAQCKLTLILVICSVPGGPCPSPHIRGHGVTLGLSPH